MMLAATQAGIAVFSDATFGAADNSTIMGNTIFGTHDFDGIEVCSNNNTASLNVVNGSDESGIHIDDSCTGSATGNSVTKNIINSACAGILSGPSTGNITTPNAFYNVVTLRLTGTNICTPPPARNQKGPRQPAHRRAARP